MTDSSSTEENKGGSKDVTLTVEDCLATHKFLSESFKSATLMGMVTRCRFHCKMNPDGSYKCCQLMISSLKRDNSKDLESDNSCLQALEMTLSVVPNTARMIKFNEMLDIVWPGVNLMETQKVLGSSFWVLGDSGRTCVLTFGGSEDIIPGSSCSKSSIKINFPNSSLQFTKLGYVRSFCTQDRVDAVFVHHSCDSEGQTKEILNKNMISRRFDFVGGLKVMNGMLNRRPSRRNMARSDYPFFRLVQELITAPSDAIPLNTLSDLFELIFRSLREPNISQRIMNPSLVRRISNGRFLALSFCQVRCYCFRCFCSLVNFSRAREGGALTRKRNREQTSSELSFWHRPHPEEHLMGIYRTSTCDASIKGNEDILLAPHVRSSNLRCPKNGCSKNSFGVKWECSGILDDGTGQATLYADGDAALTLLGMSVDKIQTIEEGLWSIPDGNIQFMRSIPPPKHLRDKVLNILAARTRNGAKESKITNPIRLLSIQDRATYLLERHCRSSNRPRRYLDYYVRCKPLVTKNNGMIPHIQHTKIDSFFKDCGSHKNGSSTMHRSQFESYTVPPLKLELVDCGVSSFAQEAVD